jgi:hypothetical protein
MHRHARWIIAALLVAAQAHADTRPVRKARSANGEVVLRIVPGRPARLKGGACRGILRRDARGAAARELWSRPLVNEIGPMYACVSDDARFVVTLDDLRHGGAKHAVVIYDAAGEPVREFALRELLPAEDMRRVKRDGEALEWLDGAEFTFDAQLPQFVITLAWEREIRIDLEKLVVVGADSQALERSTGNADDAATSGASQSQRDEEVARAMAAIEQLLAAARALEGNTTEGGTPRSENAQAVSSAAQELMRQQIEETARQAVLEAIQEADPTPREWDTEMLREIEALGYLGETEQRIGTDAVGVPAPQPGDPVDYVAWLNTFTQTGGPSAATLYEAASDATVKNDFPDGLLEAARAGDPEALADPLVTEWLDANAEALTAFREATSYEFNGYDLHSQDGTMIGILLPTLSNLRELTRVSAVEARIAEANGDYDTAADSYLTAFAAAGQTARGVTLIESLVGTAMERMVGDGLLDMYARDADGTMDYVAMAERLDRAQVERRPMADTIQFERAMVLDMIQRVYEVNPDTGNCRVSEEGLHTFQNMLGDAPGNELGELGLGLAFGQMGFERVTDDTNAYYDEMTHAMQSDYPTARQELVDLESTIERGGSHANPVLSTMAPSLGRAYQMDRQTETNRRAIDTVTRLRAYRQQFGQYPDSLESIASDSIIDPLANEPFVYYRDGDDFVLYSVGHNGTDEGGVHNHRATENDYKYWPRPE